MPNLATIVMLLAAGFGLCVALIIGWVASVAFITWLHDGYEFAEKNYSLEDLERLRKDGGL